MFEDFRKLVKLSTMKGYPGHTSTLAMKTWITRLDFITAALLACPWPSKENGGLILKIKPSRADVSCPIEYDSSHRDAVALKMWNMGTHMACMCATIDPQVSRKQQLLSQSEEKECRPMMYLPQGLTKVIHLKNCPCSQHGTRTNLDWQLRSFTMVENAIHG